MIRPSPSAETLYRDMLLIRRFEEFIADIYPTDKVKSPIHLSIGQEAASVAVCAALEPDDIAFGTYRGHALYLAKGGDIDAMMAELYGKATGCARGKGGSMHLGAPEVNMMFTSAIVATGVPNAVGYAFAQRYRKTGQVVAAFFGDGATDEGAWYESVNFAALKQLPIIFVLENNLYAIHSAVDARARATDLRQRAEALGVPTRRVEGTDIREMIDAAAKLIGEIREGKGPRLLEIPTYRLREHVGPNEDWHMGYRDRAEGLAWEERDPLTALAAEIGPKAAEAIGTDLAAVIKAAAERADLAPFPDGAELYCNVYAEDAPEPSRPGQGGRGHA